MQLETELQRLTVLETQVNLLKESFKEFLRNQHPPSTYKECKAYVQILRANTEEYRCAEPLGHLGDHVAVDPFSHKVIARWRLRWGDHG